MDDHVGAVTKRLEQERRSDRVVRDDRDAAGMGHFGHSGEIDHIAGRVADGLAEDRLRPLVDPSRD